MHRRLRWGNVARAAGALALVGLVVAWPLLAPTEPTMPGIRAAPLTGDESTRTPPRAPGRVDAQARSRREPTAKGRSAGRRKRSRRTVRREARKRGKGQRAERRRRRAKISEPGSRRVGSRGTDGEGASQATPVDATGRGVPAGRNESSAPVGGVPEGVGVERGAADQTGRGGPGDGGRSKQSGALARDPAAMEFGFEGG